MRYSPTLRWGRPTHCILSVLLALICCLTTHAAIWVGMTKAELLQELGPPTATLALGNREVLDYGGGRKAQFLNGRVFKLTGFPESMISEGQAPDPLEDARTSTAYSPPTSSTNHNNQNASSTLARSIISEKRISPFLSSSRQKHRHQSDRIEPLITQNHRHQSATRYVLLSLDFSTLNQMESKLDFSQRIRHRSG